MASWNSADSSHVARSRQARPPIAFVASILAHAVILAALVLWLPQVERPHQWVLAYLVQFGDVGGGGGSAPAVSDLKSHPVISSPKPHPNHRVAHAQAMPARAPLPPPAPIVATPADAGAAAIAAASKPAASAPDGASASVGAALASATGIGGGMKGRGWGIGDGRGAGGIGDGSGSSFAHVQYGHNPAPTYPVEARRRAEHGTVLLRIKVAADSAVAAVEIAQSSGFDLLDEAALDAVRHGWRFVPARRDGIAIESWVEVPIRFALTEAQAN